mmetsp:Transcript_65169/g.194836  ORF Transcript_65169/g.194836 Transcript_65169/m.194836 type:complete len:80 (-) Transcript_65169:242-481(-)
MPRGAWQHETPLEEAAAACSQWLVSTNLAASQHSASDRGARPMARRRFETERSRRRKESEHPALRMPSTWGRTAQTRSL